MKYNDINDKNRRSDSSANVPRLAGNCGILSQIFRLSLSGGLTDRLTQPGKPLRLIHVAVYLAHVGFGLSQRQVGQMFGRHRTTVRYICARVEGRRDDPRFDRMLYAIELALRLFVQTFCPNFAAPAFTGGRA